jgi:hypothetical protein
MDLMLLQLKLSPFKLNLVRPAGSHAMSSCDGPLRPQTSPAAFSRVRLRSTLRWHNIDKTPGLLPAPAAANAAAAVEDDDALRWPLTLLLLGAESAVIEISPLNSSTSRRCSRLTSTCRTERKYSAAW